MLLFIWRVVSIITNWKLKCFKGSDIMKEILYKLMFALGLTIVILILSAIIKIGVEIVFMMAPIVIWIMIATIVFLLILFSIKNF